MKTIGLIGGISWQSTLDYYRIINEETSKRTGGKHAAKILIDSVDIGEVDDFISRQDFEGLTAMIVSSARRLETAGAQCLLIGANTMHFIAPQVTAALHIPLIHIAEETIKRVKEKGLSTLVLLGTKFTMEQDFYKNKFLDEKINLIVPGEEDRKYIHQVITKELFFGTRNPESKQRFIAIVHSLIGQGAKGIILGCTEIPMLIGQEDFSFPVFDTTVIHAMAAVDFALKS